MAVTRDAAEERFVAWVEADSLQRHMRAVEAVMRAAATVYGEVDADAERWALAGLLHDADYEKWPDEHPHKVVKWLREEHEDEPLAVAILAHTGDGPADEPLSRALIACDELTGLVVACSYVRPEGIGTLTPKSVKKKLKDKSFAAGVDRGWVSKGFELIGAEPAVHIQFIIDALKPHANELGIAGKAATG